MSGGLLVQSRQQICGKRDLQRVGARRAKIVSEREEPHLGCKQRIRAATNGKIGSEPAFADSSLLCPICREFAPNWGNQVCAGLTVLATDT
jgi:hypothetical protein